MKRDPLGDVTQKGLLQCLYHSSQSLVVEARYLASLNLAIFRSLYPKSDDDETDADGNRHVNGEEFHD